MKLTRFFAHRRIKWMSTATQKLDRIESTSATPTGKFQQLLYPKHLIMCRVGDFYEFYHEQGRVVAQHLSMRLAIRHRATSNPLKRSGKTTAAKKSLEDPIYFCGFPSRSVMNHLKTLLRGGFSVAKWEQYERVQANGQPIMTRRIDRIYTPGTIVEEELYAEDGSNASQNQQLTTGIMALQSVNDSYVTWSHIDLCSGSFVVDQCLASQVPSLIASIQPSELLLPKTPSKYLDYLIKCIRSSSNSFTSGLPQITTSPADVQPSTVIPLLYKLYVERTEKLFSENSIPTISISAQEAYVYRHLLPPRTPSTQLSVMATLLDYISHSHTLNLPLLSLPRPHTRDVMTMDFETQQSLEVLLPWRNSSSTRSCLMHVLDGTTTSLGRKVLRARLRAPFTRVHTIQSHQNLVKHFRDDTDALESVQQIMRTKCQQDIMRTFQNLRLNGGGLWHFGALYSFLDGCRQISELLDQNTLFRSSLVSLFPNGLEIPKEALEILKDVLPQNFLNGEIDLSELPKTLDEPGVLPSHIHPDLQTMKELHESAHSKTAELSQNLQEEYFDGCFDLQLEFKKPLGAYIEVSAPASVSSKPPKAWQNPSLQYLQSMASAVRGPPVDNDSLKRVRGSVYKRVRFRHAEWTTLHHLLSDSHEKYMQVEKKAFKHLTSMMFKYYDQVSLLANVVAELDVAAGFAKVSVQGLSKSLQDALLVHGEDSDTKTMWCRPEVVEEPVLEIVNGRHPVLEKALAEKSRRCTPNDCLLSAGSASKQPSVWTVTGPNMGGKSTYLRQNALFVIMAQVGSYVPAQYARIGVADKLFSRVGSSDNLSANQSSFMVEMTESARILQNATPQSFVIMDEVGRGTGSLDGSSLAWAILKYLHDVTKCRTLFATHFHEITDKASEAGLQRMAMVRTDVLIERGSVEDGSNWKGEIVFTHKVVPGVQRTSFGIHVAKIAGMPEQVLVDAAESYKTGR